MSDLLDILPLLLGLVLVLVGFVAGRAAEKQHYRSIRTREQEWLNIPAVSSKTLHDSRPVASSNLVSGSVVVSVDHFKRMLMAFRSIWGGEVKSYSPLIDRGRREALLRMKESCPDADLFLNCRLETAAISNGYGKAVGTVEVHAYGTAVRFLG